VHPAGKARHDRRARAFDVQAVCSGFVYALALADKMVASGMARNALVVGAEIYSRILDWNDRGTCVLFGDGAGAVVLMPSEAPAFYRALACRRWPSPDPRSAGLGGEWRIEGSPFLTMDGHAVFKFAVQGAGRSRARSARRQRDGSRARSTG
jgi:3-oxoacyl-[acyl-carrier-protein] synthase-3